MAPPVRRSHRGWSSTADDDRANAGGGATAQAVVDGLHFTVELIDKESGARVLGRASRASMACAIFAAACAEYPDRRIVLRSEHDALLDSAAYPGDVPGSSLKSA